MVQYWETLTQIAEMQAKVLQLSHLDEASYS